MFQSAAVSDNICLSSQPRPRRIADQIQKIGGDALTPGSPLSRQLPNELPTNSSVRCIICPKWRPRYARSAECWHDIGFNSGATFYWQRSEEHTSELQS